MFDVSSDVFTLLDEKPIVSNGYMDISDDEKYVGFGSENKGSNMFYLLRIDLQNKQFIPLVVPNIIANFVNLTPGGSFLLIFNSKVFLLYDKYLVVYKY
jgi:hypothetical protein